MLSINTLPSTIAQFTNGLTFGKFDIERLVRPSSNSNARLDSAYAKFANSHNDWIDSHFDEHFLAHGGADTLAEYTGGQINRHEAAVLLAEAWDKQMGPARTVVRKRRVAEATLAAERLLGWFEMERALTTVAQ